MVQIWIPGLEEVSTHTYETAKQPLQNGYAAKQSTVHSIVSRPRPKRTKVLAFWGVNEVAEVNKSRFSAKLVVKHMCTTNL